MFYDRPDCIKLSFFPDDYGTPSGVFVFKNFFSEDQCKLVEDFLSDKYDKGAHEDTLMSWYAKRVTPPIPGIIDIWEALSELIYPEFVIHPAITALAISAPDDEGMFAHSDSPGKNMCNMLTQVDIWKTCCELDYGLIAYFGNFEGGEIYYTNINPDGTKRETEGGEVLTYKPERGDVVIHGAFNPHTHGVRPVTSGVRYAFSNFVLKPEANPGTFYNYKTPEYYAQIGDKSKERIKDWSTPLKENPQFSKERIKMMQASGLEGAALAEAFPFEHEDQ